MRRGVRSAPLRLGRQRQQRRGTRVAESAAVDKSDATKAAGRRLGQQGGRVRCGEGNVAHSGMRRRLRHRGVGREASWLPRGRLRQRRWGLG